MHRLFERTLVNEMVDYDSYFEVALMRHLTPDHLLMFLGNRSKGMVPIIEMSCFEGDSVPVAESVHKAMEEEMRASHQFVYMLELICRNMPQPLTILTSDDSTVYLSRCSKLGHPHPRIRLHHIQPINLNLTPKDPLTCT